MNRIKDLRIQRGMTQKELAKRLNCASTAISKYELEQLGIDSEKICILCDIFGCTADYLLCRSENATPELSAEEENLLAAYRRCDDRARDIVTLALAPFAHDESSSATG